jgi:hypothetical protein
MLRQIFPASKTVLIGRVPIRSGFFRSTVDALGLFVRSGALELAFSTKKKQSKDRHAGSDQERNCSNDTPVQKLASELAVPKRALQAHLCNLQSPEEANVTGYQRN